MFLEVYFLLLLRTTAAAATTMMIATTATTMYRVIDGAALLAGCVGVGATEGETVEVGVGVLVDGGGVVTGDGVVVTGCGAGPTAMAVSAYEPK